MIGIYAITNPNGRVYIGQSKDISRRFREYKSGKDHGYRLQRRLNRSFKKHGIDKHEFDIIEFCTIEELNKRERHWQEFFNVLGEYGLNCKYQNSDDKPVEFSECTRKKMSESRKGVVPWNKGIPRTEEQKLEHSLKVKGKIPWNKGIKTGIEPPNKGKPMSEEQKHKLYLANKGRPAWNKGISSGLTPPNAKKVIDTETQEVFNSVREAADKYNINSGYLRGMLRGDKRNKTNLKYLDNNN